MLTSPYGAKQEVKLVRHAFFCPSPMKAQEVCSCRKSMEASKVPQRCIMSK